MSDHTHDTSELRSTATAVDGIATTAVSDISTVVDGISSRTQVWGTDAVGGAFAGIYLDPAERAMAAVVQGAYQIGQIAELLGGTAQGYDDTESENVAAASGVQPGVST